MAAQTTTWPPELVTYIAMATAIWRCKQQHGRMYDLRLIFQLSSTLAQLIVGYVVKLTEENNNKRFRR
jgi:hypothetical protein